MVEIKQKYNLFESLSFAFRGIGRSIKKERNLKIHLGATILAILLGLLLKISSVEWLILLIFIVLVIAGEIFNSSIEACCDLLRFKLNLSYYETYWIRNFSAGAVLVLAIGSLIAGIIIFLPKIISSM